MKLPDSPIQRRHFVAALLKNKGISFAQIAREEGVSPQAISQAFICPNDRLEKVIARKAGFAQQVLFSDRYADDGTRLVRVFEGKSSSSDGAGNVQNREVA